MKSSVQPLKNFTCFAPSLRDLRACMSRYHSYLNTAKSILEEYKGEEPFSSFLKKTFSLHKKFGSKDRKHISHLCYCYLRLGKMQSGLPVEDRLLPGLFLCSAKPDEILQELKPGWNERGYLPLKEKLSLCGIKDPETIFPFTDELSRDIDKESFILSHLKQPDLFLRLRPGKENTVKQKLKDAGIDFKIISETCLALPNASKIDTVVELNKEAVVQDYSSQRVGELVPVRRGPPDRRPPDRVWDCCAGSGGKSIMLHDIDPGIELTVSDVRESILINLKKRFKEAGITNYKDFVADLSRDNALRGTKQEVKHVIASGAKQHLIIADVPCTGSGTWGRTPEQLSYFEMEKIGHYTSLQRNIVSNVIPHILPGGYLLYVTCSVFKKENEDAVEFIQQRSSFQLQKMEVLRGYDKKADTMFAALLQKPL